MEVHCNYSEKEAVKVQLIALAVGSAPSHRPVEAGKVYAARNRNSLECAVHTDCTAGRPTLVESDERDTNHQHKYHADEAGSTACPRKALP